MSEGEVTLEGQAGQLQAQWSMPHGAAEVVGAMVVCHPHPLYGGTMDNKVVTTLARAGQSEHCAALRFNFRGVGESEGIHDGGDGEVDDVIAAIAEAESRYPDIPIILAGFSFGGAMAVKAAQRHAVTQLITIAPALNYWGSESVASPGCPWLLVHGDADDVVDCEDTLQRASAVEPSPHIEVVKGVGHFFHGELNTLKTLVVPAIQNALRV